MIMDVAKYVMIPGFASVGLVYYLERQRGYKVLDKIDFLWNKIKEGFNVSQTMDNPPRPVDYANEARGDIVDNQESQPMSENKEIKVMKKNKIDEAFELDKMHSVEEKNKKIQNKELENRDSDELKTEQILKKKPEIFDADEEKIQMKVDDKISVQKEITQNKVDEAVEIERKDAGNEKDKQELKEEIKDDNVLVKKEIKDEKNNSALGEKSKSKIRKFYFYWLKKVKRKQMQKKELGKIGSYEGKIQSKEDEKLSVQKKVEGNKADEALETGKYDADKENGSKKKNKIKEDLISVKTEIKDENKNTALGKNYNPIRKSHFRWFKKMFKNQKKASGSDADGRRPPHPCPPKRLPDNHPFIPPLPGPNPVFQNLVTAKTSGPKGMDGLLEELKKHPKFVKSKAIM